MGEETEKAHGLYPRPLPIFLNRDAAGAGSDAEADAGVDGLGAGAEKREEDASAPFSAIKVAPAQAEKAALKNDAHILDCWRLFYETDDLENYFAGLETAGQLPNLDTMLDDATTLADRYTSQAAIQNSMRTAEATSPKNPNRILTAQIFHQHRTKRTPDSDRVLRNSEIFLLDFGWWIEMAWSVSEGDIGRVWEIIKIWIFKFAGSSHQNYMKYLLEFYCVLRYEASEDLSDAILDNLLQRINAELGKCIPGDLLQEHYNKWLQAMSRRHGGEFDEPFFRQTVSPNVEHFLRFKEDIETAFNLKRQLRLLLTMFKDEEVHTFRAGRSMGHAAVNQFA
ncbi:hypothetical protein B0H14DRAFT_3901555 [Mycena olivaceomarginata]|nr:hypothetical protein B0H14DRAFT_3901555 [Mycena olivaceomarginata]